MSNVVLDASALIAYLYQEPGSDVVESAISMGAVISAVNWAEVLSKVNDKGEDIVDLVAKVADEEFDWLTIFPVTEPDAIRIAELRQRTKILGLSLGDRACLALGLRLKLTVLTADRIWKNLAIGIPILTIR